MPGSVLIYFASYKRLENNFSPELLSKLEKKLPSVVIIVIYKVKGYTDLDLKLWLCQDNKVLWDKLCKVKYEVPLWQN